MPQPVPDGYRTVTPFLCVTDAARLVEFIQKAFGATAKIMKDPHGGIAHAELKIGDSMVMLGQVSKPEQAMQAMIHLYVPDTDAVYRAALAAGATSLREPANQFYGDRSAGVRDPSGNHWYIATHVEDVTFEEMEKRMAAMANT